MMFGKSIIVARNTNMDRIITEDECRVVVTYGKVNELGMPWNSSINILSSANCWGKTPEKRVKFGIVGE